jgi:signal transduction histidine kinase
VGQAGTETLSELELQTGFDAFLAAARRLEQRYDELKQRAAAVDLELQRRNAELAGALREREAIFAALPIGLFTRKRDGSIACCNAEAERLCGGDPARAAELCSRTDGDHQVAGVAVRLRSVPMPDGALVIAEDRSRVQELEREVHRLDRLAGLSELALGVAHEIRNPLNGVMGFAAMLERRPSPDSCQRFAARIQDGLRQIDGIVRAMLSFARPERGRGARAPVVAVLHEAAAGAGVPAQRVELRGDGAIQVDAEALLRVLGNLFRNSREAAGDGVRLQVHVAVVDGAIELVVTDNGPGVPAAIGNRAFEPFVSTKERGTGLGLALSARVLGYLGGSIALLNPGEPGARFRVRLPLPDHVLVPVARGAVEVTT